MIAPALTSIAPIIPSHSNESQEAGYSTQPRNDSLALTLSPCFALKENGLVVSGSPSIMEWLQVGEQLQKIERHIQFAIGDWLNYGERTYGEMYSQALEVTDYKQGTLRNFSYVANRVELSLRNDNLSFNHHVVVAPLEPDEQKEWLEKAVTTNPDKPLSVATLRNAIKDSKQQAEPSWLKHSDVWNFTACDERFGIDYPGRIPGQIVLNVLHYYTKQDDLVIDPMAGGGVTIDACKELNRHVIAFDRIPSRDDIQAQDATEDWKSTEKANLVFIDPPYYSQMEKDYGGMAMLSYQDYLKAMQRIFNQAKSNLDDNGVLAVLIAPMAVKTPHFEDTTFDFVEQCKQLGFDYVRRISVPVSTQQIGAGVMEANSRNGVMNAIIRDLVIFKKL